MKINNCILAAAVSIACHATAFANPVLLGTTTNPIGFEGLVVNGVTYNVSFSTQSYDTTFASAAPTFLRDEDGGRAANFALVAALAGAGVTALGSYFPSPVSVPVLDYEIYIPTEFYSQWGGGGITSVEVASMNRNTPGVWQPLYGGGPDSDTVLGAAGQRYAMYAVFSVPEPSGIALTFVGLAAFAWTRKKRSV